MVGRGDVGCRATARSCPTLWPVARRRAWSEDWPEPGECKNMTDTLLEILEDALRAYPKNRTSGIPMPLIPTHRDASVTISG